MSPNGDGDPSARTIAQMGTPGIISLTTMPACALIGDVKMGIAGISDRFQVLLFAPAFWNGADSILKERLFGLNCYEGNHGEGRERDLLPSRRHPDS